MTRYAYEFGSFEIDPVPGQPQIAHCHGFFVPIGLRGRGNGLKLKREQMKVLERSLFDYATCTVVSRNFAQIAILTRLGWECIDRFDSCKTGDEVELWRWKVPKKP